MSEEKAYSFKDGKLIINKKISLDPNKDGENLLELTIGAELDLAEVADEIYDYYKSKKGE